MIQSKYKQLTNKYKTKCVKLILMIINHKMYSFHLTHNKLKQIIAQMKDRPRLMK